MAPSATTATAPASDRWGGLTLLAVIGALGVGAVLGHWATPQPQPASAPATQVIRVTGDGGTAAPAAATPAATAGADATATPTATATATPKAKEDKAATKDLSKDSIKDAVKKKQPISTGGTPPPKDNKPPAGGAGFEDIG